MNICHCASRLIAIGAFALGVPTLASASDAGPTASFKLAMGPMSAAQKNQGPGAEPNSDQPDMPHHRIKPHHHQHHHHRR